MFNLLRKRSLRWAGAVLSVSVVMIGIGIFPTSFGISSSAKAAPARQIQIYTPTPGPDGRIIYIVKANDTLLSISLISGVPVDEIKALNNMTNDTIFEGQKLLLGLGGPLEITVTPGPTPTPTSVLPTPTEKPGFGNLCVLLFDDRNGDSIRQEEEPSIPDGAISIRNKSGNLSETTPTGTGLEPHCYEEIPEGKYTISVAVPEGFNATTESSYELELKGGDETYINFGAQANAETLAEAQLVPAPEGGRSPILGIVGAVFLVAGVVVAFFASRLMRGR